MKKTQRDESVRNARIGLRTSVSALTVAMSIGLTTVPLLSAPALAQDDSGSGSALGEVIITARYRAENLQQTPLAISAFTGASLEQRSLDNVARLGAVVPNAYIRPNGAAPTIGIRGVIATDYIYATEPAVGVYIDDTYFGTLVGAAFDLVDVDRVEVLRGPQGTLFGKNSLGGAIRVVSKKPTGDGSIYAQGTYGSYNRLDFRGGFDASIIPDTLFLRATALSKHRKGYIKRLDFTCQMIKEGTPELAGIGDGVVGWDSATNAPIMGTPGSAADNAFSFPEIKPGSRNKNCLLGTERGEDKQGGRLALRYVGTDSLEVNVTLDYMDDNSEAFGAVMKEPRAFPLDSAIVLGEFAPRWGITDIGARFDRPEKSYTTFETYADPVSGEVWPDKNSNKSWGTGTTVDYDITDGIHAKAVGAYRRYHGIYITGDALPLDMTTTYNVLDHHQTSFELDLTGNAIQNKLEWTLGAFYYDATSHLGGDIQLEPFNFMGIIPPFEQNDTFRSRNESAFLHLVFHITDKLSLTAGGRFTHERKAYTFDHTGFLTIADPSVSSTSRFDWKAGLDYKVTDALMVYGQASTGFRSAGFQPRPWTPGQLQPFPQEEVTSYEVGFKGDMLDERLRLNADVFYMDYSPRVVTTNAAQCTPFNSADPGAPVFGPLGGLCPPGTPLAGTNGWNWFAFFSAPGKVKGFEIEATARPIDNLTITYTAGYNDFSSSVSDPTNPGYRNPHSLIQPKWNMSAGIQYDIMIPNGGTVTPRLDWTYTSHNTNSAPAAEPDPAINVIPGYNLFNARLTYNSEDTKWSVALSVTNLFNKFYWYSFAAPGGQNTTGSPGRPREWAITLRRNF